MRRKATVERKVLTLVGEIVIARNLYQADAGGPTFAPLDHRVGIAGHYATPEAREATLFLGAQMTARETAVALGKSPASRRRKRPCGRLSWTWARCW